MKIGIAATSYGPQYPSIYSNHIAAVLSWSKKYDIEFEHIGDVQQYEALNQLTRKLLDKGCSHILFIEHDNLMPDNLLDVLIATNKPIVSGTYNCRRWPFYPVPLVKKDGRQYNIDISMAQPGKCFEVDAACFGCCLVQAEVFNDIPEPYFDTVIDGRSYTADVVFFDKVKKAGYLLWIVSGAECPHIGDPVIVTSKNWKTLRDTYRENHKDSIQKFVTDLTGMKPGESIESIIC